MKQRGNLLKGEARFIDVPIQNKQGNMKLIDYISKHYSSVTAFAENNGMKRQQAAECVNKGYYHVIEIGGELMLVMAKRKIKRVNDEQ